MMKARHIILLAGLTACFVLLCVKVTTIYAATATVHTDGDHTAQWTTFGTHAPSTCSGQHCGRITDTPISTANGIETTTALLPANAPRIDEFTVQNTPVGQGATQIKVFTYARTANSLPVLDAMDSILVDLWINGAYISGTGSQITPPILGTAWAWYETTFDGNWTQSQVDAMHIRVQNQINGGISLLQNNLQIAELYATVTSTDHSQLTQSYDRFYQNTNTTTPGTALAATNTLAESPTMGTPFRLRLGLTTAHTALSAGSKNFKLQYATRSGASCSNADSFADVTSGSGAIRWYDNAGVADGATISSFASDPVTAETKVYQTYRESSPFTSSTAVPLGQVALWDFALQDVGATPGAVYCFRIVEADNTLLTAYSVFPAFRAVGEFTARIVNSGGTQIVAPTIPFASLNSHALCQLSTAHLGTSSERLRIINDRITTGWNATLAATNGPTTHWSNGLQQYSFNNPGGSPAGCGVGSFSHAGRLHVMPPVAQLTPLSGCSNTGVSLGSAASFSRTVTDEITLVSASSSAARFCYWDVTGIELQQRVPASQPSGNYSLDFTITVVAQ